MIKAVTFDLWHTLIYEPTESYTQRTKMIRMRDTWKVLKDMGYKISYDEVKVAYHVHEFLLEEIWSNDNDVNETTQIAMLLDCLRIKSNRRKLHAPLRNAYGDALLKNMPALSDGVADALALLKKKDYKIGMISNTGHTAGRGMKVVMKELGVLGYFDVLSFSGDMRIRKPRNNIFTRTLGSLGVKPKNAAHVGDNVMNDVVAAKNVGMTGILYDKDGTGPIGRKVDAVISNFGELPGVLKDLGGKK